MPEGEEERETDRHAEVQPKPVHIEQVSMHNIQLSAPTLTQIFIFLLGI
jgi:hypothetical protein